jgi:hypothetical protein
MWLAFLGMALGVALAGNAPLTLTGQRCDTSDALAARALEDILADGPPADIVGILVGRAGTGRMAGNVRTVADATPDVDLNDAWIVSRYSYTADCTLVGRSTVGKRLVRDGDALLRWKRGPSESVRPWTAPPAPPECSAARAERAARPQWTSAELDGRALVVVQARRGWEVPRVVALPQPTDARYRSADRVAVDARCQAAPPVPRTGAVVRADVAYSALFYEP